MGKVLFLAWELHAHVCYSFVVVFYSVGWLVAIIVELLRWGKI